MGISQPSKSKNSKISDNDKDKKLKSKMIRLKNKISKMY